MPIMWSALKGDIIKLQVDFFNGYRDVDRLFYISAIDPKWDFQLVDDDVWIS